MKSFLSFANSKLPYTAIAIGKFDGMHKAHLKLLGLLGNNGCALSIASIKPPFVTPPSQREKYTTMPFYRLRFESIKSWDSLEFLKLLFFIVPHLNKIIVGYDFCFGKNRMNSVSDMQILLESMGKHNVEILELESQKHNGTPIHTSIIKELIKYGDIVSANAMLCRFYSIKGRVINGQGLGRKALYPTINIKNILYLTPKHGVYATFTLYNNHIYKSVSFIGNRLSTDNRFCIETHIIDNFPLQVHKNEMIEIFFVERLRNNQKFTNLALLKQQITQDIVHANAILEASCNLYPKIP